MQNALTVKDFSAREGVSESIIYRHIRNHKNDLDGKVLKQGGRAWITDDGQALIRSYMIQQPIVVGDGSLTDQLEQLKNENIDLLHKVNHLQAALLEAQVKLADGEADKKLLAASEKDRVIQRKEIETLAGEKAAAEEHAAEAVTAAAEAAKAKVEANERAAAAEAELDRLRKRSFWDRLRNK